MNSKDFDKNMRKSIDHFVDNYKIANCEGERQDTSNICLDYITKACNMRQCDPAPYRQMYLDRVGEK